MQVGVLGETTVLLDGAPVPLSSVRLRQIVAALSLGRGQPVAYDELVDLLWGDRPPDGLPGTLHAYVAALRRLLEPDRAPRAPARVLVTAGSGYALRLPEGALDADRLEQAVREAGRGLGRPDPLVRPDLDGASSRRRLDDLEQALASWRGPAYADLEDRGAVPAERARLEETRVLGLEHRATLTMALGGHAAAVVELEAMTAAHPMRERLWMMRAQALHAVGRQAEALAVLRDLRALLDTELGVEPSPVLRDLEVRILRQDPALAWAEPPRVTTTARPPGALGATVPERARPRPPDWPLVGRSGELAAARELLERAASGRPGFLTITGEPGIGKSRMCSEVAALAVDRGARLLVGRCLPDHGSPPLWPWQQVLAGLGRRVEVETGTDDGAAFRTWESLVRQLLDAADQELLVVVLDDLHWADVATLRVLRVLVGTATAGRLLVLATWRSHPPPTGALAEVADALARSHALRLPLVGLGPADAGELIAAVSARAPVPAEVDDLATRTDGNPFYLVEFARLSRELPAGSRLSAASTPAAVQDVVAHRIDLLPERAVATLRAASVVGRAFELATLVAAVGRDVAHDEVLDDLDTAVAAGLVREDGPERWSFTHALVRDAAYEGLGATRAARSHAAVASLLEQTGGGGSEVARHWLRAGPAHARAAWRAAADAAAQARALHAHETAARLLSDALVALQQDRTADVRDRHGLLLALGDAERWSGRWDRARAAAEEALLLAEGAGDTEMVVDAASAMTRGTFWPTTPYGVVRQRQVAALRRALAALPAEDAAARCRLQSTLALETYYETAHDERTALVEESRATARRLGDETLVLDTTLDGFVASWRPATARDRLALVDEALDLCRRTGDARRSVVAHTWRTVVLGELGRVQEMWASEATARAEAERLRIPQGLLVLDALSVPWLAMAGREEEAVAALGRVDLAVEHVVLVQTTDARLGAHLALQLWCGDVSSLVQPLQELGRRSAMPSAALVAQVMVRSGDVDGARRYLAEHPADLPEREDWFTPLATAAAAESALWIGDRALGAAAYRLLAPAAGMTACAGSGAALGPVDAFLAAAAAAAGERGIASRHADDAAVLMRDWGVPRCAAWFADLREEFGF